MTAPNVRRFLLHRLVDETGISGEGIVAEGVMFSDGTAAMRWVSAWCSTAVYASMEELEAIHGHGGRTEVLWLDPLDERGVYMLEYLLANAQRNEQRANERLLAMKAAIPELERF